MQNIEDWICEVAKYIDNMKHLIKLVSKKK
jgi:hypothetical protein